MAIREIPPLEDKEWDMLVKDLEHGQTKEQAEFMKKSIEHASKLNVSY